MIELFIPSETLDLGLAAQARSSAAPDLDKILEGSFLAASLFSGIQTVTTASSFGKDIEDYLQEQFKTNYLGKDEQKKIHEHLAKAESAILALDPSSAIEIEFVCGGMAASFSQSLEDAILRVLPGHGQDTEIRESLESVTTLSKGAMARLSSRECQAKVESCIDILQGMLLNRPPPMHMAGSTSFWRDVFKKLGHFCREDEKMKNQHGVEIVEHRVGLDAMKLKLTRLGDRIAKQPTEVALHEVEAMHTWSFLMNEAERTQMAGWLRTICAQKSSKRKGEPSVRVAKEKKEKKEKKGTNVDEFFTS